MKVSKSSLVLTAAFTGLLGGTMTRLNASTVSSNSRPEAFLQHSLAGTVLRQHLPGQEGKARLQGPEFLQGQGRLQDQRQRLQRQELLQGQGRLRHRRFQEEDHLESSRCVVAHSFLRGACATTHLFLITVPANRFNGFTDYGIGVGLRIPHYQHILEKKPVVSWFEIISENYMVDGGRPLAILDQILEQYRVVQHGVSMYFGSAEPLNRDHLRRLKALVKRTKTPWLTDHLCWGSVDGRYTHDLLPMPYTFEAAKVTARKVREARRISKFPSRSRTSAATPSSMNPK